MKHHFADFLDRENGYWTIVPNRDRFAYTAEFDIENKEKVKILTISKNHTNWMQVFDCPIIEEVTLHDPGKDQVNAIRKLTRLKRLRVTFLRTKDIGFIGELHNLEEIVLEYVSGFSDLSPLKKLSKLRSLHLENLRGVSDFDGLKGVNSLKYLHIDGTWDWNQPVKDFEFLRGLPDLEFFSLGFINSKAEFPAFLPLIGLEKLNQIKIVRDTFTTQEFAFLQAALPNVKGCDWDLLWDYDDKFEFLGKRAGFVRKNTPNVEAKCEEFIALFEKLKKESEEIIAKQL